jgi:hypothetical protein
MTQTLAFVLPVLGLLALAGVPRVLRDRQRLRLEEMAHRERMLALEKGVPVSEIPGACDLDAWADDAWTYRLLDGEWDRRAALGAGLVMLFAGAGALLFAWLAPAATSDAVTLKVASGLGIIPFMASIGMLLYYRLTAPGRAVRQGAER